MCILLPALFVLNYNSFDFFILSLTTRLIQKKICVKYHFFGCRLLISKCSGKKIKQIIIWNRFSRSKKFATVLDMAWSLAIYNRKRIEIHMCSKQN